MVGQGIAGQSVSGYIDKAYLTAYGGSSFVELRQLEYFLAVVVSQSFTQASAVLGIAQPALSRQIRQLEDELGVQLLYRHGRGVRPTEEGAMFQASLEPLMREIKQVTQDIRESAKIPAGEISLGMPPSMSATIGASVVRSFREKYPQVRLHIVDGFSGFINEWLVAGRIDMAVINQARRSPLIRADHLLTVDLYAFGSENVLAGLTNSDGGLPVRNLQGTALVLPTRNHGLRRELDAAAQRFEIELSVVAEMDALSALKELVRQGMGITVLPHGAIYPDVRDQGIAVRRIVEPELSMSFTIAYSLQRPMTLGMRELARTIRREVRFAIEQGRLLGRVDA